MQTTWMAPLVLSSTYFLNALPTTPISELSGSPMAIVSVVCGAAAGAAEAEAAHRKNPAISKETMVLQLIAFSSF